MILQMKIQRFVNQLAQYFKQLTLHVLTYLVVLIQLLFAQSAFSEDTLNGKLSTTFTLATDYVFRGESETNDGSMPTIQLSTTWTHQSNMYVGLFGSTNKFTSAPKVDSVIGPYLGNFGKIANTSYNYNVFVFHYMYPNNSTLNYTELWMKLNKKFDKLNVEVEITPTLNDWFGVDGWKGVNYALHSYYDIVEDLTLSASYGHQSLTGNGAEGWEHWNAGVKYTLDNINFDVRYHNTNIDSSHQVYGHPNGLKIFDDRVVAGVTVSF
jgi:uncharacterized protein (TIGR02001 family)